MSKQAPPSRQTHPLSSRSPPRQARAPWGSGASELGVDWVGRDVGRAAVGGGAVGDAVGGAVGSGEGTTLAAGGRSGVVAAGGAGGRSGGGTDVEPGSCWMIVRVQPPSEVTSTTGPTRDAASIQGRRAGRLGGVRFIPIR
jgi:hypothetical protein